MSRPAAHVVGDRAGVRSVDTLCVSSHCLVLGRDRPASPTYPLWQSEDEDGVALWKVSSI